MTDIVLVKSDPILNQSSIRAIQIVKSLGKRYSIIALGWKRGSNSRDLSDNEDNIHLFHLNAPFGYERYGAPKLLLYFPIFWIWTFMKLCAHRPKVVHACDLATILPCYFYKVLFRKKLIFDVLDRYSMTYITRTSNAFCKSLFAIVNSLEEFFARNSDVLLGVSDKIFLTFRRKPKNCFTIMNCPEDQFITTSGIDENLFKIIYTGAVRRGRGLEVIANIVSELSNVQLNITGKIKDLNLQNRFQSIPNIKYHGFLEREKLLDLEIKSDAMIALYDLNLQSQYEYGMANKVLEAMMCGIPVITNISHDLINDTKCGIIVKYDDIDQIKSAIVTLRDDPSLRKLYGNNGRKAYLEKYNWTKMEEKLYNIYQQLLSDNSKAENPQL